MRPKFFDHIIVEVDTPEHAQLWTTELGVSLPTLQLALHRVGPRLNDIREELGMAGRGMMPPLGQLLGLEFGRSTARVLTT